MSALFLAALAATSLQTANDGFTYQVVLLRAAPGDLIELIEAVQSDQRALQEAGEERPTLIRHSQGDHWDLMLVHPIGDLTGYYSTDRLRRRQAARQAMAGDEPFATRMQRLVAWREETFFSGPPIDDVRGALADAGYFHIEMFIALPGKRTDLVDQRERENAFLDDIRGIRNLVFQKTVGGAWDVMTIGLYRDLQHYAEPSEATPDQQERAARAAGFEGRDRIGTYLRSLISRHNDTLGTAVR